MYQRKYWVKSPECRCNGDNVCQAYISGEIVNYCDFHTEHEMGRYENHVICPVCHCHFGG